MSDMPPARDNGPAPLPRCARVALAAVGPPAPDPASRSVWADLIPLGDDRVGLVVADTASHAVPVTQLQRLVAEVLDEESSPARALTALDQCMFQQPDPPMDGVAQCAVLDGAAGTLLWSGAGAPVPLVVGPAGTRLLTGADGPPLGRAGPYQEGEAAVEAGATVVMGTVDDGIAASAARHHDLAPGGLAAALLADPGAAVASVLLLARLIPAPLAERLPADPRQLPALRRRLSTWSAQAALSDDTTADLQLLLSEAATNSVEHAYRDGPAGEFVYSVRRRGDGAVQVAVQDFGRWRPPPADPGYRGRGLAVIHTLGDEVTLEVGDSGTRVAFTVPDDPPPLHERRPVPSAAQWWATSAGNAS